MAHIKKIYYINSIIPIEEFSSALLNQFEKECVNTRINVVKKTNSEITFKGPLFRYTGSSFHYLNGITCGKLEIINANDSEENEEKTFILERTFCYKEAMLLSLAFTILPVWIFFSSLYQLEVANIVLNNKVLGLLGLFIIWGVFFAGNIIYTSFQFSKFLQEIKTDFFKNYIAENKEFID